MIGACIGIALALGGVFLYGRLTGGSPDKVPALPDGPSAVITHIAGPVYVLRGSESIPAFPGERLEPGDIVKVTEGAVAQVQLADKGSALLGSDTLVRFLKLTGADQKLELRTEILTGSLSYKVEKLDETESIVIESDGTEYEIRGTEFVIRKQADGTVLIVGDGEVRVMGHVEGGVAMVGPGKQLYVAPEQAPGTVEDMTEENRLVLEESTPLPAMPYGYPGAPEPVLVEINADPPDAQIYIDGLKTGTGRFRSLLPKGTIIDVRIRRRGFDDYAFELSADSDTLIDIELKPSGLEDTLEEAQEESPLLARLRADYDRRLADLRSSFADASSRSAEADAEATAERRRREQEAMAQLEIEKARSDVLETELTDAQAENQKLRDLIRQIQDLTDD